MEKQLGFAGFNLFWSVAAARSAQIVANRAVWGNHIQISPGNLMSQHQGLDHREMCRSEMVIPRNQNSRSGKCCVRYSV